LINGRDAKVLVAFVNNNNNNQTSPVAIEVLNKRGHCIIVGLLGDHRIKFLPLVPLLTFNIYMALYR